MQMAMTQASSILFRLVWLFIIGVSVFDAYLVLHLRDVIQDTERNPVGLALLSAAQGHVWLFLLAKITGTVLACTVLLVIFRSNGKLGFLIALVVGAFQFGLLMFLRNA